MARKVGASLMILGAVALGVGPALDFVKDFYGQSLTGYDTGQSQPYIGGAAAIGISGLLLYLVSKAFFRSILSIIGLATALFCGYAGYVDLTGLDASLDPGIGTWLVFGGSVGAALGGFIAMTSRSPKPVTPPPPAPRPPGLPPPPPPPPRP